MTVSNSFPHPPLFWGVRVLLIIGLLVVSGSPSLLAAQAAPAKSQSAKPAATSAKKAPAAKKPVAAAKKPAARKAAPAKRTSRAPVRRTTRRQPASAAKPRVPLQPGAERLTEIQSALAGAGYLESEPNGKWDDTTVAAMKRFQQEHAIPATGKINSLSLIALGLGPKRGPSPGSASVLEEQEPTSQDAPGADASEANSSVSP